MSSYGRDITQKMLKRAQGCLLGQLAGDALGSLVEFHNPRKRSRGAIRADGGTWNTIAGQPTDDSEMALLLARMLVKNGSYESETAQKEYQYWLSSDPFDCGITISAGHQRVRYPRPEYFWPADALELADGLVET